MRSLESLRKNTRSCLSPSAALYKTHVGERVELDVPFQVVERLRERLERRHVRRDFGEGHAHRPYVRADVDEVRVWGHARGQ